MNLEYPDHDKSCDDRSSTTEQQCLSLRNPFRFDFNINGNRGVIVERHSLCAWDACSQSCYAAKPDEDAATQVSHFLLLLVVFWATIPYCRCVMWLVETYLLAPSPWAKEAEACKKNHAMATQRPALPNENPGLTNQSLSAKRQRPPQPGSNPSSC